MIVPNPIDFESLLHMTQVHITEHYAAVLTEQEQLPQLRAYIDQFVQTSGYEVDGLPTAELTNRLYREMAEYSLLTPLLAASDNEEINLNAWDDIALTHTDGRITKADEHFRDSQHAEDIVKRLLHHSGMVIDAATPIAQGHLPNNARITALKAPIVDDDCGVAASIRLLHPQRITRDMLLSTGMATEEMLDFLVVCIRYGVSMAVSGATSTGKTTLINCLLGEIPDNKRVFTIESGARELCLVKKRDGKTVNNVIHTLSRPSDNPAYNITQEQLVEASLRFSPDVVVIGEMRNVEAFSAVEASLTGHTVVSTIHSSSAAVAHTRIALLCQRRLSVDFPTALTQAGMAFPVIAQTHQLEDNSRRIMDISECEILPNGQRTYHTLYRYEIESNALVDGQYRITGRFVKVNPPSESLQNRLRLYGIPQDMLNKFTGKETMA